MTARIAIEGAIGLATVVAVRAELDGAVGPIEVHLDSPGGSVPAGLALFTALRRHGGPVTARVGRAASIAVVVALAADDRVINDDGSMAVHRAWGRADAAQLAHDNALIASIFAARAGGTAEWWARLMDLTTVFDAPGAVRSGLATITARDAAWRAATKHLTEGRHVTARP